MAPWKLLFGRSFPHRHFASFVNTSIPCLNAIRGDLRSDFGFEGIHQLRPVTYLFVQESFHEAFPRECLPPPRVRLKSDRTEAALRVAIEFEDLSIPGLSRQ